MQLLAPEGFAHGFCVLSETAIFHCKCSEFQVQDCESGIRWPDPDLAIDWPFDDPNGSDFKQNCNKIHCNK